MQIWEVIKQYESLKQDIETTADLLIRATKQETQLELVGRLKLAKHELKTFERLNVEFTKTKLHKYGYCARCGTELKKADNLFCKSCKKEVGRES
ncbi:hypothetical protein [Bacillus phage YungSlug]|nr:hypothetical protein [Bacillus phage YungSlug]